MRALRVYDDGLRIERTSVPRPATGEALVRVHAAAITRDELTWPVDRLPAIPSYELSGVVAEVASGVRDVAVGDAVYALTPFDRDGVAADYAVVPAAVLAPRPRSLTHVESAALPLAGLSAWQGLFDHGALRPGERVRVLGPNGGVAHLAVQLARGQLAAADEPCDLVFDTVGGEALERSVHSGRFRRGGGGGRDLLRRRAEPRTAGRARAARGRRGVEAGGRLRLPPRGGGRGLRPRRRARQAGQGGAACRGRLSEGRRRS